MQNIITISDGGNDTAEVNITVGQNGETLDPIVVDLGPNPTWPTPVEQADLLAAAVREAWIMASRYWSGDMTVGQEA